MINNRQFRDLIIRPTLDYLDMGGLAAERLLLGTALTESRLTYLKQLGGGPARGVYQMEIASAQDIWRNYLTFKRGLQDKVEGMIGDGFPDEASVGEEEHDLIGNLYYATAMCRIHYWRVKEPLPDADDAMGLALYWKTHYNTPQGKGKVNEAVEWFKQAIEVEG